MVWTKEMKLAKQHRRAERERDLAEKQRAMGKIGVIYAHDPLTTDWSDDDIAKDAVLFLRATPAGLVDALRVMEQRGFKYKSSFMCPEENVPSGIDLVIGSHVLVLVGSRGKPPAPAMGTQFHSLIRAPNTIHDVIERYFPNMPRAQVGQ
jgi:hypothetical protein